MPSTRRVTRRSGTARKRGTGSPSSPGAIHRRRPGAGWTDSLRHLHPDETIYTFWDYMRGAFSRNAGLRIDHLLLSPELAHRLKAAGLDRDVRALEQTSDH